MSLLLALLVAWTFGCPVRERNAITEEVDPRFQDWAGKDHLPAGDGLAGDPGPEMQDVEVCDGRDNDGDGSIDEETGGDTCTLATGDTGTKICIGGMLRCSACYPHETRTVDCGCNVERTDVCDANGVWHVGVCDGCGSPEYAQPCGFCGTLQADGSCAGAGECEPGTEMFRRCDFCPPGETCGATTCVGERLVCAGDCTWERVESCEIRPSECSQDSVLMEPCGSCGFQMIDCDGCFWDRSNRCNEQGTCVPGSTRSVPCFAGGCAEGFAATVDCTSECIWSEPGPCGGCQPGQRVEFVECVPNHPDCGIREITWGCTAGVSADSCVAGSGTESMLTSTECPPVACLPGESMIVPCTTPEGLPASNVVRCSNSCEWLPPPDDCGGSCVCPPGDTRTYDVPCGCGEHYTVTENCSPDCRQWVASIEGQETCPPCKEGETETDDCDLGCGTLTRTCNSVCQWVETPCEPNPNTCNNGDTESRACNAQCGAGHEQWQCVGCSWQRLSACTEDTTPECRPGDARRPPGCPAGCNYTSETCDPSTCTWTGGTCETPCG